MLIAGRDDDDDRIIALPLDAPCPISLTDVDQHYIEFRDYACLIECFISFYATIRAFLAIDF